MENNFRQDQIFIEEFKVPLGDKADKATGPQQPQLSSLLDLPNLRNEDDNVPSTDKTP